MTIHIPPGGQKPQMIDGDHGAKAAVHDTNGAFEVVGESARILGITTGDRAGRFFADFAGSVPPDQPVEESLETILSVTQRHGVRLAGG